MKRTFSSGSQDEVVPAQRIKLTESVALRTQQPCPLLQVLAQYGLLAAITTNLFPGDLYSLAATSKATYRAIFACPESHVNLLGKMSCDGRGLALRRKGHKTAHKTSQSPRTLEWHFRCESTAPDIATPPTRPCSECKYMTCDECRIHCVFQTTFQEASGDDEVPILTGFALLSSEEMGILTPYCLGIDDLATQKQQNCLGLAAPYHDMGYLEPPLTSDAYASSESIEEIINFELGTNSLRLPGNSTAAHPTSVIRPFWTITEERKWSLCRECVLEWRKTAEDAYCRCTLKRHLLDRWLCLPCYQKEVEEVRKAVTPSAPIGEQAACNNCGDRVNIATLRDMCVWCLGECLELIPPRGT